MKKKISIKATIEKKNNLIKVSQRVDSDILLLEKNLHFPQKKQLKTNQHKI